MNKVYSRIIWKNYPNTSTAINETNLNRMDKAIDDLDNRVIEQDSTKANQTTVNSMVKNWTMDETTGVITVEKQDGSKIMFDLNIEKIPVTFELSPSGILTMTTSDGTQFTANIGSMIPVLTFNESDQIAVSVSGSGVNKTYSFSIKDNSITENKLQPNFLADIKVQSANASLSANNAETSATQAQSYAIGGTGTRENEDTDNAMYYYEQAKQTDIGQISSKVDEINSKLSKQLGNHTVKSDVPENAVFTDTVYDDTEVQKRISDNGYGEVAGGKNLMDISDTIYTETLTDTTWSAVLVFPIELKSGTYSLSFLSDKSYTTRLQLRTDSWNNFGDILKESKDNEYLYKKSFVLDNDTTGQLYVQMKLNTGNTVNCYNIQIEEGSVATEYEPYFPSNKMLSEEKADKSEITVNLLNPTKETITQDGVTFTNNNDGTYTMKGTATQDVFDGLKILTLPKGRYKIVGAPSSYKNHLYITKLNDFSYVKYSDEEFEVTDISQEYSIVLRTYLGSSYTNILFKPMLTTNLDATYDDFVQYTGDTGKLNSDVAKIKNDLDKLSSLPIGSIIQIDEDKDDLETTAQKYGWQYLGKSNIKYESGSATLLVTNVYRKNH